MNTNTEINSAKNTRNSSFELLRIIVMFSIVLYHFATHGKFNFSSGDITIPYLWWSFIKIGGNLGIDVFVLISGYFLIDNKSTRFDFVKILKFWGQVFFYSVVLSVLSFVIGYKSCTLSNILTMLLPITFSQWWFPSTYFVLFLLHPYINSALHKLDQKQYQKLLILLSVCWCLIPTVTTKTFQANNLIEFIYLYTVAGYIRIYGLNNKLKCRHFLVLFGTVVLLTFISCVTFSALGTKFAVFSKHTLYLYGKDKISTVLGAVFVFSAFVKIMPFYNKTINKIASATFGVYLLHDSRVLRKILWVDLFKNASFEDSNWLILYSVAASLAVFFACVLTDWCRQSLVEKPYVGFLNKYRIAILKPFTFIYEKVRNLIFEKN